MKRYLFAPKKRRYETMAITLQGGWAGVIARPPGAFLLDLSVAALRYCNSCGSI